MPRGKRNMSTEERLMSIREDIQKKEQELKDLKKTEKELFEALKQEEISELYNMVKESGKSIEEIKKIVSESK